MLSTICAFLFKGQVVLFAIGIIGIVVMNIVMRGAAFKLYRSTTYREISNLMKEDPELKAYFRTSTIVSWISGIGFLTLMWLFAWVGEVSRPWIVAAIIGYCIIFGYYAVAIWWPRPKPKTDAVGC